MKIDDIHEMAHDINNYVNEHHMLKSLNQQLFDENERLNAIIDELEEKIDKAISYIYVLKNNVKDFKTEYKEDMLNMLDDIGNILGDKENE